MDTELLNKNNSGGRFLRLFQSISTQAKNAKVIDAWKHHFSLPDTLNGPDLTHEIATLLGNAIRELGAMEAALLAREIPENLVSPYITRAKNIFSVGHINGHWELVLQYRTPDLLVSFEWFSFHLDEDELAISDEQIAEMAALVTELESLIEGNTVPSSLAAFVQRHLDAISLALRNASVQGAAPLRKAMRDTLADIGFEREELVDAIDKAKDPAQASEVGKRFFRLWKRGVEICGDMDKLNKGVKLITDTVDSVTRLFG